MIVQFFDYDDDTLILEQDVSVIPRIGETVHFSGKKWTHSGFKVKTVDWHFKAGDDGKPTGWPVVRITV